MEAAGVVPVHPAQGGQLDVLDGLPGAGAGRPVDQFGLVVAVDRLGQGVVEAVTDGADRGDRADLGEAFAVADGRELRSGIGVTSSSPRNVFPRDQRAISIASRTIVVRMWPATRQPTIIRLNASMMKQT